MVLILYQLITDDSALPKLLKLPKLPISALLPSIPFVLSFLPHLALIFPAKAVGNANRNLTIG